MSGSVSQWLGQLGFGQYAEAFAENDIEWGSLPNLDKDTLQTLDVTSARHQSRILTEAKKLGRQNGNDVTATPEETPKVGGEAEDGTHLALKSYLDLMSTSLKTHKDRVVQHAGDAVLADFSTGY